MKAADVMTTRVISVTPDTPVRVAIDTLLGERISAVPVLDRDGCVLGIVSEKDLMRRVEIGTERRRAWQRGLLASNDTIADDYAKSHATKVADVMTQSVVSVGEETPLGEVASLFERHRIKRVPVVRDCKVVGIVSRADLLRAISEALNKPRTPEPPTDWEIRERVQDRLRQLPWGLPSHVNVHVKGGDVSLSGVVSSEAERRAVRIAAEGAPGVHDVRDALSIRPAVAPRNDPIPSN